MSLAERIQADLKDAMRAGDVVRRETLRMLLSDMKYRRIELGKELVDEDVEAVLRRAVKTRQESAEQFAAGGRAELAAKERQELALIERYLPQQMSLDDVRAAVRAALAETGAQSKKDTGTVMKALMQKHKGRIDGKTANQVLAELLK